MNFKFFLAAHCIHPLRIDFEIYALLGRFNISNNDETEWVQKNISKKILHPDYKKYPTHKKSDADIAVLIMESPVKFTKFIRPICVPSSTQNVDYVNGSVAGYGRTQNDETTTNVPYKIDLTTESLASCFEKNEDSTDILTSRTFCANNWVGVVCKGKKII